VRGLFPWLREALLGPRQLPTVPPKCSIDYCESAPDPRCRGMGCLRHCDLYCNGVCRRGQNAREAEAAAESALARVTELGKR